MNTAPAIMVIAPALSNGKELSFAEAPVQISAAPENINIQPICESIDSDQRQSQALMTFARIRWPIPRKSEIFIMTPKSCISIILNCAGKEPGEGDMPK